MACFLLEFCCCFKLILEQLIFTSLCSIYFYSACKDCEIVYVKELSYILMQLTCCRRAKIMVGSGQKAFLSKKIQLFRGCLYANGTKVLHFSKLSC